MNPFTNMTDALTARGAQRGSFPRVPIKASGKKPNKTQALRDYLRDTGPATAVVLADEVGLERVDLVSALLGKDLILGRVYREGIVYHFNHQYADTVRANEEDMARRLRLAGWTATPPTTGQDSQGPFTESITWFDVVQGGPMPDAFTCVLLELEDSAEPVWAGCWDGERWCDTYSDPIHDRVSAWAHMPFGQKGGAQ
jgi:hypothetical protein